MTLRVRSVVIPTLSDADNNISTSQTPGAAGALTITGTLATAGVATVAAAQKLTITSAGNDSGRTFVVTGTDADGVVQTENVTGPNTTTTTTANYYKTVTSITVDAATAGAIKVGAVGSAGAVSPTLEINVNEYGDDFKTLASTHITGAGTYAVQTSPQGKNDTYAAGGGVQKGGFWVADTTHTGKTADFQSLLLLPAQSARLIFTSWTSGGATLRTVERTPDFRTNSNF